MANYTTTADLIEDVLSRADEPTDGSSDFLVDVLRYINLAYQAIASGASELSPELDEDWLWLRKSSPGILILQPIINVGSVSVTQNSSAITFSTGPTPDVDEFFFQIDGRDDVFRISAHDAGATVATLDSVYTGETNAAANYQLMKMEYTLATDIGNLLSPMRAFQTSIYKIDGMSLERLEEIWPTRAIQTGVPQAFSRIDDQKVRFSHAGGVDSTDLIRVEYEYSFNPIDLTNVVGEEPVIPRRFRRVLAHYALSFTLGDKGDNRASDAGGLARNTLRAMVNDNRKGMTQVSDTFAKIIPRPSQVSRLLRIPRSTSGLIYP